MLKPLRAFDNNYTNHALYTFINYVQNLNKTLGKNLQISKIRQNGDLIQDTADSMIAPGQWETSLQSNAISHWMGASLESSLYNVLPSQAGALCIQWKLAGTQTSCHPKLNFGFTHARHSIPCNCWWVMSIWLISFSPSNILVLLL